MIELDSPRWQTKDIMIYVGGSKISFRCECACNVFRKAENDDAYKCNACQAIYRGEK